MLSGELRSLTFEYAKQKPGELARCPKCERVFYDDVPLMGSLPCPDCKDTALRRGLIAMPGAKPNGKNGIDK